MSLLNAWGGLRGHFLDDEPTSDQGSLQWSTDYSWVQQKFLVKHLQLASNWTRITLGGSHLGKLTGQRFRIWWEVVRWEQHIAETCHNCWVARSRTIDIEIIPYRSNNEVHWVHTPGLNSVDVFLREVSSGETRKLFHLSCHCQSVLSRCHSNAQQVIQ